jgi:hypothetical protein
MKKGRVSTPCLFHWIAQPIGKGLAFRQADIYPFLFRDERGSFSNRRRIS